MFKSNDGIRINLSFPSAFPYHVATIAHVNKQTTKKTSEKRITATINLPIIILDEIHFIHLISSRLIIIIEENPFKIHSSITSKLNQV